MALVLIFLFKQTYLYRNFYPYLSLQRGTILVCEIIGLGINVRMLGRRKSAESVENQQ